MQYRLWVQIAATLAINLLVLCLLLGALVMQQTNSGLESFLYAPARERVRELGRLVEEGFPQMADADRSAWLAKIQEPYGVTLAVYEDTGRLVAGPDFPMPEAVRREIQRQDRPQGRNPRTDRPNGKRRGASGPPIFLIEEDKPPRYWIGYHFPIVLAPGHPPVRHTLAVIAPSLLTPFFIDWVPWLTGACVALLVTLICWVPLIRRFTRSINAVRLASAEIAEGRFDVQIPVTGNDELADLASSVRRMAEQLSRLVHGQRRFLADVAHELCAPLSRIQLSAGILQQNASGSDSKSVERLERDVAHMSFLVGDLLSFTKAAVRKPELAPVRLAEVVQRVIEQEGAPGVDVATEVSPTVTVLADQEYLDRAFGNVLRNAIRYAGEAGPIRIRAQCVPTGIQLIVQDCGPGLPDSDLDAIFSPFYRPDNARTPGTGGAGLGLAIVKSCIEACEGTVCCRNRKPMGLEVVIELKETKTEVRPTPTTCVRIPR